MAKGPVPHENPARRNNSQTTVSKTTDKYPPLPGAETYSARTRLWYETWALSEQASQFSSTDWQRLQMLAPLVELYFEKPSKDLMAEIRQNEAKLGATAEDRQRLRWKIGGEPKPAAGPSVAKPRARERRDPRANQ